jgi:transcriptional regulator GlxA family with amidase domain
MTYEPPVLHYEGALGEVLHRLVPKPGKARSAMDWRVQALLQHIDSRAGIEWDLKHACRELKLDISAAYAARLFKRCTGQGIREYTKTKRLLLAAERLTATALPIKVIAAECGYRKPVDFARIFKERYSLSPTKFRKQIA